MMILYSGITDPFSHRCRFVLHEKEMDFEITLVEPHFNKQDLGIVSTFSSLPVLIDRDLSLYYPNIICEYVEERFPHPQFMPPDPITRARMRQLLHTIETDVYSHVQIIETSNDDDKKDSARKTIRERLIEISVQLEKNKYLLGIEMSMIDTVMAPLLWRLQTYRIELPNSTANLLKYAERLFIRPAFINSLTAAEKVMRK